MMANFVTDFCFKNFNRNQVDVRTFLIYAILDVKARCSAVFA